MLPRMGTLVLSVGILAGCPGRAPAQNQGADLIPDDALVGVVIKNLDGLSAKVGKLCKELNLPETTIESVLAAAQLDKGVSMKGSLGIVVPNLEKLNLKLSDPPGPGDEKTLLNHTVLILPVADADAIGGNFGLKKGELKPGIIAIGRHQWFDFEGIFGKDSTSKLYLTDNYLYASHSEAAIKAVRAAKLLPASLADAQTRLLREADVVVHFGPLALGEKLRQSFLSEIEKNLLLGDADDGEVKELTAALKELRGVSLALRVEDGLTLDFLVSFKKPDGAAAKFLTSLRGGPGTSDLNGLPAANPLGAYAAKGDGTRNAAQARTLFKLLLKNAFGLDVALQGDDRAKLLAAFDVLYKHLRGSRAAAYRVDAARAAKVGQMAAILILDLDDPGEHLSGWKNFIEVANRTSLKINNGDANKAPRFSFTPGAEKLDGMSVDVLAMENPKLDPAERDKYIKARGPSWNKIQMVTVGKQVVALFASSDTDRLRTAIKNVKEGNKGLADNPAMVAQLRTLPADRKIELHGSGDLLAAFGMADAAKGPPGSWTSIALVVEPDRLQLRWRLPLAQMKAWRN